MSDQRPREHDDEATASSSVDARDVLLLQLRAVLDSLPAMVGYWDTSLRNTLANQAYVEWFGLTPEQMTGMHIRDVIGEKLYEANEPYMRLALQGRAQTFFREITDAHGCVRHTKASYLPDVVDGTVRGFVAQVVDVTDIHLAREEAEAASAFFEAVVTANPDFTFVVNLDSGEMAFGSRDRDVLGLTAHDLAQLGPRAIRTLVHPDDQPQLRAMNFDARTLDQGEVLELRYRGRHADGTWRWLHRRITPFRRDADGRVVEVLGIVRDVTDLVEAEQHLAHVALHDDLTGLPNRVLLLDRLEAALARSARDGEGAVSLLFCDLDGFKRVNDRAGHAAGDAVLVEAASRIRSVLREGETVSRFGGDEFVVVLEPWHQHPTDLDRDAEVGLAAVEVAARISAALRPPFVVSGGEYVLGVSIGIAHAPAEHGRSGVSAEELLRRADIAMYQAKALGKGRYHVFEPAPRTVSLAARPRRGEAARGSRA